MYEKIKLFLVWLMVVGRIALKSKSGVLLIFYCNDLSIYL